MEKQKIFQALVLMTVLLCSYAVLPTTMATINNAFESPEETTRNDSDFSRIGEPPYTTLTTVNSTIPATNIKKQVIGVGDLQINVTEYDFDIDGEQYVQFEASFETIKIAGKTYQYIR